MLQDGVVFCCSFAFVSNQTSEQNKCATGNNTTAIVVPFQCIGNAKTRSIAQCKRCRRCHVSVDSLSAILVVDCRSFFFTRIIQQHHDLTQYITYKVQPLLMFLNYYSH
jgi:hypothetical protein